jgi:imidazolonepropionase-like amidohydrolase
MAAINAARALGAGEHLGSVEPGKLADLIITDKDPLENIRNIRDIRWVVQNGEVYTMEELLTPLDE